MSKFERLTGGLGLVGLVCTSTENFLRFSTILEENFWPILILSCFLLMATAWPKKESRRVLGPTGTYRSNLFARFLRYRWTIGIILIFVAVGFHRFVIINTRSGADAPAVKPGDIPIEPTSSIFGVPSVYAQQARRKEPTLIQFTLRPEKTLFVDSAELLRLDHEIRKAKSLAPKRAYELSWELVKPIRQGTCNQDFKSSEALEALRSFASKNNRVALLKYVETEAQLRSLIFHHADVAKALMPNSAEWSRFNRLDYFAVLNWVRNCVGIYFPVFLVTIENPSDGELWITEVRYNIIDTRVWAGFTFPPSGPLSPTASYTHRIDDRIATQSYQLVPAFRISAKSAGSFELQVYTGDHCGRKVDFLMDVGFVNNQNTIKTELFLVRMSCQLR